MHGTVKGGTRKGRQRKRWEDNIKEWTGLEFGKRPVENGKMKKTGCKIICGAPTTFVVKGWMMMMMMINVGNSGMHFSCKLHAFFSIYAGRQTFDETITIVVCQTAKYTPLAIPAVEAWSVVCFHYFWGTERGRCFTRARLLHVTLCTVYSRLKLNAGWKGKTTAFVLIATDLDVAFEWNSNWVKLSTRQTDKYNKNKHTCMANNRNKSLSLCTNPYSDNTPNKGFTCRLLRQWSHKMGWTHHMLK